MIDEMRLHTIVFAVEIGKKGAMEDTLTIGNQGNDHKYCQILTERGRIPWKKRSLRF